jgi:hypothetical protein
VSIIEKLLLRKQEAALKKIARQEFELARGTAHVKLLQDARKRIESKTKLDQKELVSLDDELRKADIQFNTRLKDSLDRYLIDTHLCEIPGIGPKLQQMIAARVFKGKLSDLRHASNFPGIGYTKQYEINFWVDKYERITPELFRGDFPGKSRITLEFTQKKDEIQGNSKNVKSQIGVLEKQINVIDEKLKELNSVTENDFIEARLNPDLWKPKIDSYLCGVFGEWETAPDWFKEIISVE